MLSELVSEILVSCDGCCFNMLAIFINMWPVAVIQNVQNLLLWL